MLCQTAHWTNYKIKEYKKVSIALTIKELLLHYSASSREIREDRLDNAYKTKINFKCLILGHFRIFLISGVRTPFYEIEKVLNHFKLEISDYKNL